MRPDTILAFDTSAAHCAAALLSGEQIVAARLEPMEKGQAERLMLLLQDLLAGAGLGWGDLTALAVGTGPGNFTGIRISVAAARGLALGLGIPALGVTRLEALAHGLPRPLLVAEDARRGAIYVQGFGQEPRKPCLLTVDEAATLPPGAVTGSGAALLNRKALDPMPLAEAIAHVAAARLGDSPGADLPRPAPFYLRGADAAPPSDPPPVILDTVT
ncbi:tRNA (adenosine(37)-N6)-threonylcarbamoyltransferase complex dimerization subunit type 1 TsaB [Szabonella alba]|uniref:tRNA (Adenosine(37)-N6)-threonylcarbamoyltransferase complex dimerization subunit type 1 TsaB n=1 Tax=Szabonella alba TaxID=2804194 RepID=A0A8K0VF99_9RHOB|nr:tRNA (adenosine(37)-N6)-threonylcarbamoyltransferase complex dimerization subunit type 1 TsaB [Szabonella alba]MBL4917965.1 tRNA (adenosine(37)-N6)-threonylcarbamoyltransferase complex dimerization subunit type 1 TsaB [Szabonella alba]